ncbi:hypothetical protein X743_33430 [Mesorhizobium sp. LNHC252B00]|nr:hypothetical protein X743_33430 [Mesorhizobium sp. LNHC252B00]
MARRLCRQHAGSPDTQDIFEGLRPFLESCGKLPERIYRSFSVVMDRQLDGG